MAEDGDLGDIFADELAEALRSPGRSAPRPRPRRPTEPFDSWPEIGEHEAAPEVLRNRPFTELFADATAEKPGETWGSDPATADDPDAGPTVAVRSDPLRGLLELHAGAPGPAGEASLELRGGLIISVDAAAPRRLTSIVVDRLAIGGEDDPDTPTLAKVVHPMLEQLLVRGVPDDGEWHAVPLPDASASDLDALGRFILLADEAGSMPAAGPVAGTAGRLLPRAALFTEALTHIPRSLRHALGPLPVTWARRAALLLLEAQLEGGLRVPDEGAAQELANGARAASQVLAGAEGHNPLEDRRVARRVGALADLLEQAPSTPAPEPSGESPRAVHVVSGVSAIEVHPAPALRDRWSHLAGQVSTQTSVTLATPGEIEVTIAVSSGSDLPASTVQLWARVSRRAGAVPLALAALVPDDPTAIDTTVRGRAVVPAELSVDDMIIDITDDPAEPVPSPSAVALDRAIAEGRAACRHERRGEEAEASTAWERCADAWSALGDDHRAAVARRYASGSHPGHVIPFLADRLG